MLRCSTMQQIGVRDLRQQASRYLKRVQAGEAFEVTDNGRPVARLVPVPSDPWQALTDSGQVIPAEVSGGLLDIQALEFGIDASAELAAMRALEDR
jgi:prevent-host-death family protein